MNEHHPEIKEMEEKKPMENTESLTVFANPERLKTKDEQEKDLELAKASIVRSKFANAGDLSSELSSPSDSTDISVRPTHTKRRKRQPVRRRRRPMPSRATSSSSDISDAESISSADSSLSVVDVSPTRPSENPIRKKAMLLAKLERKQRLSGIQIKIPYDGTTEDLELMWEKVNYETRAEKAVKLYSQLLVFTTGIIETLSTKIEHIDLDLDGWSHQVYQTKSDYDEYLYDIYDMYGAHRHMNPIIGLTFALAGNAMMYSMARKVVRGATNASLNNRRQSNTGSFRNNVSVQRGSKMAGGGDAKIDKYRFSTPVSQLKPVGNSTADMAGNARSTSVMTGPPGRPSMSGPSIGGAGGGGVMSFMKPNIDGMGLSSGLVGQFKKADDRTGGVENSALKGSSGGLSKLTGGTSVLDALREDEDREAAAAAASADASSNSTNTPAPMKSNVRTRQNNTSSKPKSRVTFG